jgi:hypothetical protein
MKSGNTCGVSSYGWWEDTGTVCYSEEKGFFKKKILVELCLSVMRKGG